jgi:PLP dependent protein
MSSAVADRLSFIRERIADAARAAGRNASGITLVAVSKRVGTGAIRDAYAAGQRDFGENYLQEATAKIGELAEAMPDARWHFVGRLQSNKAAAAARSFSLLHGIDSLSTVAALSRAASRESADMRSGDVRSSNVRSIDVLLQIRLGERSADGSASGPAAPAARGGIEAADAENFLRASAAHSGVRFTGLMGVADPDRPPRPQFAGLRELAIRLAACGFAHAPLGDLSMGMTDDFHDAIAEGATIVRIGTAIFGERPRG